MITPVSISLLFGPALLFAAESAPAIEERLADLRSPSARVRADAAATLGELGDGVALPRLLEALEDEDRRVRRETARALGKLRDARAVKALSAALDDRDVNVRFLAAHALGELKDARAARALLEALGDREYVVRVEAAWALRELGDGDLSRALVNLLGKPKVDDSHLLWLLGELNSEKAVRPLSTLLDEEDAAIRRRAVRGLAAIERSSAIGPLESALDDSDVRVRRIALETLRSRGDETSLEAMRTAASRETDNELREIFVDTIEELSRDPRLLGHWSFDEEEGDLALDATGRGADGRIIGASRVKGRVGRALRFAKGDYVELGKPNSVSIRGTPLTIMAWIRPKTDRGVIVARGGAFCGFSLYLLDGFPRFGIHREKDGPAFIAAGGEKVPDRWVHLAGVVEEKRISLHVDGERVATATIPGLIPSDCGQGMEIGFDTGTSPAEICDPFVGVIDEVKVYRAALSAGEMAAEAEIDG